MNKIIELLSMLLGLENEPNIEIDNIDITCSNVIVHISYKTIKIHCPKCGKQMTIKSNYIRTIKTNISIAGKPLIIKYKQRTWIDKNPDCTQKTFIPPVNFITKHKQISSAAAIASVKDLSDPTRTFASVAKQHNISDTELHNLFMQYVNLKRLEMPEILCIDEVHTDYLPDCKYSLVLMEFTTQQIIDILPSRREIYTKSYFSSIPLEERLKVKVIISDMYQPYLNMASRYFPNAVTVVDSFHVVQWIINEINKLLAKLIRKHSTPKGQPESDEHYLLSHYKFFILKNPEGIFYYDNPKYVNSHFKCLMPTVELEKRFFSVDPNLRCICDLKNMYISFNQKTHETMEQKRDELNALIIAYENSKISMFEEFARLLAEKSEYIINSFLHPVSLKDAERLNNCRLESFMRKPKDLIRTGRGFTNFEAFRQRLLFSNRASKVIRADPLPVKKIRNETGKERGYYKKKTSSTRLRDFVLGQPEWLKHSTSVSMSLYDPKLKKFIYIFDLSADDSTCRYLTSSSNKKKCTIVRIRTDEIDSYFKNCTLLEMDDMIATDYLTVKKQLEKS